MPCAESQFDDAAPPNQQVGKLSNSMEGVERRGAAMTYLSQRSFDDIESRQHRAELVAGLLVLVFVLIIAGGLI